MPGHVPARSLLRVGKIVSGCQSRSRLQRLAPFLSYLLASVVAVSSCAMPPAVITATSGDADLARLLDALRTKARQPALAAAIVKDGKIQAAAAVGRRRLGTDNWVTVHDRFLIGSCGKAFTATLAALLVEEGRLRWDETVRDVFPDVPMGTEYQGMTLEQLLSHRAGLLKSFVADLKPTRRYTATQGRLAYLEQVVETKLLHPPGAGLFYSNAGYIIAGAMMERVSGQEFTELMAEKVFRPWNLKTAAYGPAAAKDPESQPWGHRWNEKSRRLESRQTDDAHWVDPAGNISLSIGDWAEFVMRHIHRASVSGQNALREETLRRLHTPPDTVSWMYDRDYFEFWNKEMGWPLNSANYALGWFVTRGPDGETCLHHEGTTQGFQAAVYLAPSQGDAILLATNGRLGHRPLHQAAKRLKEAYGLNIALP